MLRVIVFGLIMCWGQLLLAAPAWFTDVRIDTPSEYYGCGSGDTGEDAVRAALNEIASKISVTIESSYSSMQAVSGSSVVSEQKNQILSNVKKMNFNSYETIKTAKDSDVVYVLVRVDRAQLLEEKKGELDILYSKLSTELSNIQNASDIEKYKAIVALNTDLQTMNENIFLGKSISQSFDASQYVELYKKFSSMLINSKSNIILAINTDSPVSKNFSKVFANFISKQGIKISQSKPNATLVITTNTKEKKVESTSESIQNAKFVAIELSTTLKKPDGTEIASNSFKFVNNSSVSYDDALKKTQKLEKFLSENPEKVLSFIFAINKQEE